MPIITTCCCGMTLRKGSFLSGFFSLGFYTIIVATGAFQLNAEAQSPEVITVFSLLVLLFACLCVLTSILLLIGICVDSRFLLIPWIISVSFATSLDFILSFYLLTESFLEPVLLCLFIVDMTICFLNIYSIICIISQYQVYSTSGSDSAYPQTQVQHSSHQGNEWRRQQNFDKLVSKSVECLPLESTTLSTDINNIHTQELQKHSGSMSEMILKNTSDDYCNENGPKIKISKATSCILVHRNCQVPVKNHRNSIVTLSRASSACQTVVHVCSFTPKITSSSDSDINSSISSRMNNSQ